MVMNKLSKPTRRSHQTGQMTVDAGRRRFISALGRTALGLSPPAVSATIAALSSASAFSAATAAASRGEGWTVKFPTGTVVPALGQGSARLAEGRHPQAVEEEALRMGLALGMTLIDTAETATAIPKN